MDWMIDPDHHAGFFISILIMAPISSIAAICLIPSYHILIATDVGVMIASPVYWIYPVRGWRRSVDRMLVMIALLIHYGHALHSYYPYTALMIASHILSYSMSWRAHHRGCFLHAALWWIILHMCVHGQNILLYMHLSQSH